jgi:hypothetical protein
VGAVDIDRVVPVVEDVLEDDFRLLVGHVCSSLGY